MDRINTAKRYTSLDILRGLTLISMILYHACWDLVWLYDVPWRWYQGPYAYLWQQSICWTFILLSGFCQGLKIGSYRRGIEVFLSGILVTIVTLIFSPETSIYFGVLTLIGSSMLLMKLLHNGFEKIPPFWGFLLFFGFFIITRNINEGWLGFETYTIAKVPDFLYANWLTTYFGFPFGSFFSADYFALLPWGFLYISGYYLCRLLPNKERFSLLQIRCLPLEWLGRHSLLVYLLHQPIISAVFYLYLSK